MTVDFIGAGWNFPLQVDVTNAIALATHARDIEQAIELIIRTAPAERPMRPEFGCRIQDHLFAPTNEATAAATRARCAIGARTVGTTDRRGGRAGRIRPAGLPGFYIDVGYRVRGDNDRRNLVFPFYVIPDEPSATARHRAAAHVRAERGHDHAARYRTLTTGPFKAWWTTLGGSCSSAARRGPTTTSPIPASR